MNRIYAIRPAASSSWAGRAAFAWAAIFALISLYWAAGGLVGGDTIGVKIDQLSHERDSTMVTTLWAAFVLKVVAAALALALVEPWGRRLPRRLLLGLGWATGIGVTVYAVSNFLQHTLIATGAISTPEGLGSYAVPWHLALWDPVWLLGGFLFLAATRTFRSQCDCGPDSSGASSPTRETRLAGSSPSSPSSA